MRRFSWKKPDPKTQTWSSQSCTSRLSEPHPVFISEQVNKGQVLVLVVSPQVGPGASRVQVTVRRSGDVSDEEEGSRNQDVTPLKAPPDEDLKVQNVPAPAQMCVLMLAEGTAGLKPNTEPFEPGSNPSWVRGSVWVLQLRCPPPLEVTPPSSVLPLLQSSLPGQARLPHLLQGLAGVHDEGQRRGGGAVAALA